MNMVFIYALNCPVSGRTRYVGKAADPYSRYEKHLEENRREKTHKANWIRSVLATGENPRLEVLDEVPEGEWPFWECEWIKLYRMLGFDLTNGTDGGDKPPSPLGRRASLAELERNRKSHVGKRPSLATIELLRAAKLGIKNPNFGKKRSIENIEKRKRGLLNRNTML